MEFPFSNRVSASWLWLVATNLLSIMDWCAVVFWAAVFQIFTGLYASNTNKPEKDVWVKGINPQQKFGLLEWLIHDIHDCYDEESCRIDETAAQPNRNLDGFYNNPSQPLLGAIDTPLLRRTGAFYEDGVFRPAGSKRPNPLELSATVMKGASGTISKTGKTALLVFFGQQLVEEILDAQRPACPPEYFNIPIPENHFYRNFTNFEEIPILRTRYDSTSGIGPNNPRQQLNEITPFLDGNLVYGTSTTWTDMLRHFANGTLAPGGMLAWSDPDRRFPEINHVGLPMANPPPPVLHDLWKQQHRTASVNRFFLLGNPRGNENPMLLSFGILWFRWHNHIAEYLGKTHPQWSGDRIFNEAKKWVIATYQHLVVNVWLPEWIGERLPEYTGYDLAANPQIEQLFQTAAMRFGHTLVPSGVYIRGFARDGCKTIPIDLRPGSSSSFHSSALRTCNSFWIPQDVVLRKFRAFKDNDVVDIDRIFMGLASQFSEREDHRVVEDLRGFVFGPLEFPRRDLQAINIQRGRDHGVPDYNTAREMVGLGKFKSLVDFARSLKPGPSSHTVMETDNEVISRLNKLYKGNSTQDPIDNIDLWVGGLLETTDYPGDLFKTVLKDQFSRIRKADSYWYANSANGLFKKDQIERIEELTMFDIIMSVTRMDKDDLQDNPFLVPSDDPNFPGQVVSPVCMETFKNVASCRRPGTLLSDRDQVFQCRGLPQPGSKNATIEKCTELETYSYFSGSEISYAISVIVTFVLIIGPAVAVRAMLKRKLRLEDEKNKTSKKTIRKSLKRFGPENSSTAIVTATEYQGSQEGSRTVHVALSASPKNIRIFSETGQVLRTIDFGRKQRFDLVSSSDSFMVVLKLPREYDLVLRFVNSELKNQFLTAWQTFLSKSGFEDKLWVLETEQQILKRAVTFEKRRANLQQFFRSAFSHALELEGYGELSADSALTELTREEFENELRLTPGSKFVEKMFNVVDKDNNGYISFKELVDLLVIFSKGTFDDKSKLLFDMFDSKKAGKLSVSEFVAMVQSLVELSKDDVTTDQVGDVVNVMLQSITQENKEEITFDEFRELLFQHHETWDKLQLGFTGPDVPSEFHNMGRSELPRPSIALGQHQGRSAHHDGLVSQLSFTQTKVKYQKGLCAVVARSMKALDYWRLEAFWLTFFTLSVFGVFIERFYTYSEEKEHAGFRRITGYGVSITRGAASAMMLCFTVLLLAPCRHVITFLRETAVAHYVPLDAAISFHSYAAIWGMFFAVVHTIGHLWNFYNVATQPTSDLACIFNEYYFRSHLLPKFHDWLYGTLTGITGVLLVLHSSILFFFSLPAVRRRVYLGFWWTHRSYPIFYALLLMHGAARLVQEPHFPYYLTGPVCIFVIEQLISLKRRRAVVQIIKAEILPSNVTKLVIRRPAEFDFRSGQWVGISCPALGDRVFHPFTLSSPPQSGDLTVHIRAVGPWTIRLRDTVQEALTVSRPLPRVCIDGPYGEGHQDWGNYQVALLVGGGIGVTPFASILQDMVIRTGMGARMQSLKKAYFLWITRDQRQFEWMVDLLRDVEEKDKNNLISSHIFITQFFQKFDVRTVMLYVCERHYQKASQRSLFTGLRATTHFGHPDFKAIFQVISDLHPEVRKFGLFSCGPRQMTRAVDSACRHINGQGDKQFKHYFEHY